MGSSSPLDLRCNAIRDAWACDSLEKAETLLQSQDGRGGLVMENFVENRFLPSAQHIDTINPKTGKVYARVPVSTAEDVDDALQKATAAFKSWSKTTVATRSKYLQRIAQLLQENHELLAVWESIDQGKTLERARVEVDRAISNFR
jgi:aminomuconate-semialdehyde dehydrogenase